MGWVMWQSFKYIGCGVLVGVGLVFLWMGRISEGYGDDCGAGVAPVMASVLFLLAVILVWMA